MNLINEVVHELDYKGELPKRLNNPFYYKPDDVSLVAVNELVDWLYGKPSSFSSVPISKEFRDEINKGKMFDVLVVEGAGERLSFLAAYSGQICGRSDWQGFVPAVFDYLQPNGYFKQHEAEITEINKKLNDLTPSPSPSGKGDAMTEPALDKPVFDKKRKEGETDEEYIRRRQYENAELHRWKLRERARQAEAEAIRKQKEEKITELKTLRRKKSDDLQRWLFSHFVMLNGKHESKSLLLIPPPLEGARGRLSKERLSSGRLLPPAGSGECCEPKLLQYAFEHDLKPISMAMFWWGESPKNEIRHHLHFYPACNSKCRPILKWMLQGVDVEPNPLESKENDAKLAAQIKTLYEDDDICVISKPAGLMSVPGKNGRESVQSVLRRRFPNTDSPLIVHRLDMDTSGLMVIAKTMAAYHNLQKQFAGHDIKKRYVAVLSKGSSNKGQSNMPPQAPPKGGNVEMQMSLPLRPDLDDRPRQVVDFEYGKPAVTYYKYVDKQRVWLWPQTGRTHQLRVHCAHKLGLNNPIKGDRLYGNDDADRLYLHAEELTFTHPTTGRRMTFTDKAPF